MTAVRWARRIWSWYRGLHRIPKMPLLMAVTIAFAWFGAVVASGWNERARDRRAAAARERTTAGMTIAEVNAILDEMGAEHSLVEPGPPWGPERPQIVSILRAGFQLGIVRRDVQLIVELDRDSRNVVRVKQVDVFTGPSAAPSRATRRSPWSIRSVTGRMWGDWQPFAAIIGETLGPGMLILALVVWLKLRRGNGPLCDVRSTRSFSSPTTNIITHHKGWGKVHATTRGLLSIQT